MTRSHDRAIRLSADTSIYPAANAAGLPRAT
jgi:hypothetical protein